MVVLYYTSEESSEIMFILRQISKRVEPTRNSILRNTRQHD